MQTFPHVSVLLDEVLAAFAPLTLHVVVDGTMGAGGHAEAILKSHPEIKYYLGIDRDQEALRLASERLKPWESKLLLRHGNFSQFDTFLKTLQNVSPDAILVDLGVSSMQLDQPSRGFSFMQEGPLDMRMDSSSDLTAEEIVNRWSEEDLGRIFRDFGEEKKWRIAARAIVKARLLQSIATTSDLKKILHPVLFRYAKRGMNPLTLVFQALRICVNSELENLEQFLPKAIDWLSPGGRLAAISFHSLEDRIVKTQMRLAASDKWETSGLCGLFRDKEPLVKLISKKPIEPSEEEILKNPRSRSAKLRIVEKLKS